MAEIYNFSVEAYGFYFLDNLVDQKLAEHASELNANHTQIRSISVLFYAGDRDEPHHWV